jgi:hypothetical protein
MRDENATRASVWREVLLGGKAQPSCDFSFRRLVCDSVQPIVGRLCHFLGSRRARRLGQRLAREPNIVVFHAVGYPFCRHRPIHDLGRFFFDAWLKRRTYYAVTNRRVLVLQEGWKRKTRFTQLEAVVGMEIEGDAIGTIWFGPKYPMIAGRGQKSRGWSRFSVGEVVVFADVDDVRAIQRLILELRDAAEKDGRARSGGTGPLTYPMKG